MESFKKFLDILLKSEIVDYRYPISGCYIWLPYGISLREKITKMWKEEINKIGYKEYLFPRINKREYIDKVTKNLKSFEKKVFWIKTLKSDEIFYLSPTGETIIYPMFRKWITNKSDLPIKMYQIGSMFRSHDTGNVLLNPDEMTTLMEAHSAHPDEKSAKIDFERIIEFMKNIYKKMQIPFITVERPKYGNNPVFEKAVSFETYLPTHKRSFQLGVAYYQGQIFSKLFDVKFSDENGNSDFTYQNTFGTSERSMTAMMILHSDEHGLRLLPEFSPIQIVIIPFYNTKNKDLILNYCYDIKNELKDDFRILIDESEHKRPKYKLGYWRERGIPIRLGVSEDQLNEHTAKLLRRDTNSMEDVSLPKLKKTIIQSFREIENSLYSETNTTLLLSHIKNTNNREEMFKLLNDGYIIKSEWCGNNACGMEMEDSLPGEILGTVHEELKTHKCIGCGKESKSTIYFAKRCTSP